ncbi:UvrB/UvrC motif-containing protein [Verrucomicrobium sp. BvORR034]|uniref:UvrB/UvrC motif-containing protein n=1 Tax=Verrucomicrobium sp. BvORR034 TaxID=1396418 RepID=UPI0006790A1A|nr:UvrB/UvrC motif-containing protein [Verrucomicrobium sp. BvORR034]
MSSRHPVVAHYRASQGTDLTFTLPAGPARPFWHRTLNQLRSWGFVVTEDPVSARYYPSGPGRGHCYGRRKHLEFHGEYIEQTPSQNNAINECRFTFFQNVNFENTNGGRYDFDKRSMMPYMIGLEFENTRRKVCRFWETTLGLVDQSEPDYAKLSGIEKVVHSVKTSGHYRGGDPLTAFLSPRHAKDRDGSPITPGQIKCHYHFGRNVMQGQAYPGLNNQNGMWLFVPTGSNQMLQVSRSELFDWAPGMPRRGTRRRRERLEQELQSAINDQNFERAIILRDLLKVA